MKIISNFRKRQRIKFEARIKNLYKQEFQAQTKVILDEKEKEIDSIIDNYNKMINQKDARHAQEIQIIRDQERRDFDTTILERETEIKRLKDIIEDQKKFYESVKNREYKLEDTARKAVNRFQRGLDKMQEGIQEMSIAQEKIESYNRKLIKEDKKLIGG